MSADAGIPPVARDALRLCLTGKEYKILHEHVVKRAPAAVQKKAPSPTRFESIVRPKNKYNEAAVRASLRVFLGSGLGLKLVDAIVRRLQGGAATATR